MRGTRYRSRYSRKMDRLGWWRDGARWLPSEGIAFDAAYDALCGAIPAAPGMSRENMQPLVEGSYPEGEAWIEQFASYPELRIEGAALVFHPAPMTAMQHVRYLKDRAEAFRLEALRSARTTVSSIARDLEQRTEEIGRENSLPSAASREWR